MIKKVLKKVKNSLIAFHKDNDGDIVQTAIITGLFAIIASAAMVLVGPKVRTMFSNVGTSLDQANTAAGTAGGSGGSGGGW